MSTSPTRFASRIIIKPIPAVQHPTNFTAARAALVAIGMYLTYHLSTESFNEEEEEGVKNLKRESRLADDFFIHQVSYLL